MADIRIKDLATTATTSASDDYLALDGSTNGTRKILATNVANNVTDVVFGASGPSAKSSIAARAARQGLVFDGTSGAGITFANVAAFGTSNFTLAYIFRGPLTGLTYIPGVPGGAAPIGYVDSLGVVAFGHYLDGYKVTTAAGAVIANKTTIITIVRSSGTDTIYINGVSVATGADSSNYSVGLGQMCSQVVAGTIVTPLAIYNRALSAAEVVSLYEAGVPAGADYTGTGAGTTLNSSAFVQESGLNFDSFSGATTGGFTASVSTTAGARIVQSRSAFSVKKGDTIRATFTATQNSGTIGAIYLILRTASGSNISAAAASVVAGSNTYAFTATSAASDATIAFVRGNGGAVVDFTISSFTATPIGLLLAPDAAQSGGGLTWYDTSGNAANITLPATGVTWNVPTSGYLTSSSSLNLQAGGTNQNITLTPSGTGDVRSVISAANTQNNIRVLNGSTRGFSIGVSSTNHGIFQYFDGTSWATYATLLGGTGRFLLGTTTDSGALLQVGTNTTTSAGGMVFGTDNNLFRYNSNQLALTNSSGTSGSAIASNIQLRIENSGNGGLQVNVPDASTGGVYFGRASDAYYTAIGRSGTNLQLRNAGATALTIASTGAATFAGAVTATGNAATTNAVSLINDIGGGGTAQYHLQGGTTATPIWRILRGNGAAGYESNGFNLDSYAGAQIKLNTLGGSGGTFAVTGGAATFGGAVSVTGALKLGNAYVAGAVVGTGYVTIQDSTGTTYRVPVLV